MPMENYLVHHGIKGQKWGVRRYQNYDGTLTSAGKEHYNSAKLKKSIDILSDPEKFSKSGNAYVKLRKEEQEAWEKLNSEYTKKLFPEWADDNPMRSQDYDLYTSSKEYADKADALYDKYQNQWDLYDNTVKDIHNSFNRLANSKEFGDDIREAEQLLKDLRASGWGEQSAEASRKYFNKIAEIGEKAVDKELGAINIETFIVTPMDYYSGDYTRLANFIGLLDDHIQGWR